ncbi:MAG: hypothetical protein R3321_15480, partial [Nitrososphaeraceae archaeon]|nr:hypothetical protein [Nitrososphaeraceae archaeon]
MNTLPILFTPWLFDGAQSFKPKMGFLKNFLSAVVTNDTLDPEFIIPSARQVEYSLPMDESIKRI